MLKSAIVQTRQKFQKLSLRARPSWFWLGITGLLLFSLALKFWGLSRFNILVFDEVYFARYGNNYLNGTPFFDIHPPLGKYLIALGIWLANLNPWGYSVQTSVDDFNLPTLSYRWLNAFTGALIPLAVAGIAYQLSRRPSYALLAGLFTAVDGLLLVESRYALINVYLLLFGLLGQLCLLVALKANGAKQELWLTIAGVCLGASASVKWNGLGFLLGVYLMWFCAQWRFLPGFRSQEQRVPLVDYWLKARSPSPAREPTLLERLSRLKLRQVLVDLAVVPALVYRLLWIPHLQTNQEFNFWEMHKQMLGYNTSLGSGPEEHPYCSSWYTWIWMIRPVAYFYKQVEHSSDSGAAGSASQTIYDVHAMGNPVLWWFGAAAILFLVGRLAWQIRAWVNATKSYRVPLIQRPSFGIALFLVMNYAANLLPWAKVTRCLFIYHYMGASLFAFMAVAWVVDGWLRGNDLFLRLVGVTVTFLILLAFVFWLPVYLGLPLSPEGFQSRMWFQSWY